MPRTPSSRFVALLRAINVGGHVVKMEALRKHFTRLGFANVETFIASGNVLFDAPPRHYKLKIQDEDSDHAALIDIPLNFVSETPDVPELGSKDKKK